MEGGGTREGGNSPLVLFHWFRGEEAAAGAAYGETLLRGGGITVAKTICQGVSEFRLARVHICVCNKDRCARDQHLPCAPIRIFANAHLKSVRAYQRVCM